MTNLKEKIIHIIKQETNEFIPFDTFMEMALYEPELGYYAKEKEKVGRKGDFITTPFLSDVFAEVFCDYCSEDFTEKSWNYFCEIGAGTGKFLQAWSTYVEQKYPTIHKDIMFRAVEKSQYHQQLIKAIPTCVEIVDDITSLKPMKGIVFANEWLDALPIKVVTKLHGQMYEVGVGEENGQIVERMRLMNEEPLIKFIQRYQFTPREGHRIEVPYLLPDLFSTLSHNLILGKLILVDYMYSLEEWQQPELREGSLRGYQNHQLKRNVLTNPGEMDITYHIPLEPIIKIAKEHGFTLLESERQDQFLMKHGILNKLQNHTQLDPFHPTVKRNRAIQSLISPSGMSAYFRVLVFEK